MKLVDSNGAYFQLVLRKSDCNQSRLYNLTNLPMLILLIRNLVTTHKTNTFTVLIKKI